MSEYPKQQIHFFSFFLSYILCDIRIIFPFIIRIVNMDAQIKILYTLIYVPWTVLAYVFRANQINPVVDLVSMFAYARHDFFLRDYQN